MIQIKKPLLKIVLEENMNRILSFIIFLLLISCTGSNYLLPEEENILQATEYLNSANYKMNMGELEEAISLFHKSYYYYTLSNNNEGKLITSLSLFKGYSYLKSEEAINFLIRANQLNLVLANNFNHKILIYQADVHYFLDSPKLSETIAKINLINLNDSEKLKYFIYRYILDPSNDKTENELISLLEDLLSEEESLYSTISFAYYNIGFCNLNNKNFDRAEIYFNKSLNLDKKYGNYRGLADNLYELAYIYEQKNNDSAKSFYFSAYEIYELLEDSISAKLALNNFNKLNIK